MTPTTTLTTAPPKERPILFSGLMVRAILEGHKTVTRRVIAPKSEPRVIPLSMEPWLVDGEQEMDDNGCPCWVGYHPEYPASTNEKWFSCSYGKAGDILWVRETWCDDGWKFWYRADADEAGAVPYEVDGAGFGGGVGHFTPDKWRPSIFMPYAACRLKLRITDVRIERLHEITAAQCIAEGIEIERDINTACGEVEAFNDFISLWNGINEKRGYGWDLNPYVWVVEFERIEN